MVSRLLNYEATLSANTADQEVDSKSPGSGKTWEVMEIYADQETDVDYSLSYEERKLFDNIPAANLPDENNGISFDLRVGESEDLAILASEVGGNTPTVNFIVRVDETTG
jgi:hypothetical protein